MTLTIEKLTPTIGARMAGLDLSKPLDAETVAAIRRAWLDNIVVVFPGQQLTLEQQTAFAGHFGKVGVRARKPEDRPEGADYHEGIMLITNIRDETGKPIGSLPDGEMWFHHDMCYVPAPHKGTMLYAIEVPSRGGNTRFANMYAAYNAVPEALRKALAGRKALQVYDYMTTVKVDIDGDLSGIHHLWQPIFVVNPDTGRTALYVNRLMTARIDGLPRDESDAILEELFAITENPDIIYEHNWTVGDLLMWDNRCSIHARTDFPGSERRLMRRCTIEGEPMIAAEAA